MNYPSAQKTYANFECDDDFPKESFSIENDEWAMLNIEKHYFQSEKLEYYPSDWHPTTVLYTPKSWQLDYIEMQKMNCFFETIPFEVPHVFPVNQIEYREYLNDRGAFIDEVKLIEETEMDGNKETAGELLTNEMMSIIDKLLLEHETFSQNPCIVPKCAKPVAKKCPTRRKPKQKVKNAIDPWNTKNSIHAVIPLNKLKPTSKPLKPPFKAKKAVHHFKVSV